MYDAATAIQEQTIRRPFPLRISSIFGPARKYGSGWIGQVILIGWKCSATLTVKLNYAPNKIQVSFCYKPTYTFLSFLLTLQQLDPELCTSTLYTVYSNWHFPLREQLVLFVQLYFGGSVRLLFLNFKNFTFINQTCYIRYSTIT